MTAENIRIQNICRTCLRTGTKMLDIFVENTNDKMPSYKEMIMSCSKMIIMKNEDFPQQICINCSKQIERTFKFMQEIERIDVLLHEHVYTSKGYINKLFIIKAKENTMMNGLSSYSNVNISNSSIDNKTKINSGLYFCYKCDKFYSTCEDLETHFKIHIVDKEHTCRFCLKLFEQMSQLKSHIFNQHIELVSFFCGYCNTKCLNENDLEKHILENHKCDSNRLLLDDATSKETIDEIEISNKLNQEDVPEFEFDSSDSIHKEKLFYCPLTHCSKSFNIEEQLIRHLGLNHNTEGKAECHICQKVFKHKKNLRQHLITHKKVKRYVCKFCSKGFNHAHHLQNHEKVHTKETPFLCNECGKGFAVKYNLKVHMRRHSNEKPYSCLQCEKAFAHRSALMTHTRTHSGERPYMCSHCGKTFTTKGNLYIHSEKIHSAHQDSEIGSYKHVCKLCNKVFDTALLLTNHMKIHTRQYSCDICKQSFSLSSALDSHLRTHSVGDRPHTCSVCGAGFNRSEHLRSHILRKHTDVKPYKCEMCQKTFAQSGDLNAHRRTHTGEKPYVCQICNHGFAQSNSLKVHMRTHTGERPYICTICCKGQCSSGALVQHMRMHNKTNNSDLKNIP